MTIYTNYWNAISAAATVDDFALFEAAVPEICDNPKRAARIVGTAWRRHMQLVTTLWRVATANNNIAEARALIARNDALERTIRWYENSPYICGDTLLAAQSGRA